MLTTAEIQAELERISYRPGWSFAAYDGRFEGQHLTIRAELPDAYHPGQTITVQVESALPPIPDGEYLLLYLAWRLGRMESHELREHLRVDGALPFDPHAEYADRDL